MARKPIETPPLELLPPAVALPAIPTAESALAKFQPYKLAMAEAVALIPGMKITDDDTPEQMKHKAGLARRLRLDKFKASRLAVEKVHTDLTADVLKFKTSVDAEKRNFERDCKAHEEELQAIEDHEERVKAERQQKLRADRVEAIRPYLNGPLAMDPGMMDEETWNRTLTDAKELHEHRETKRREEAATAERRRQEEEAERARKEEEHRQLQEQQAKEREERQREQREAEAALQAEREESARKLREQQAEAEKARKAELAAAEQRRQEDLAKLRHQQEAQRQQAEAAAAEQRKQLAAAETERKRLQQEAEERRRVEQEVAEQEAAAAAAPDIEKVKRMAASLATTYLHLSTRERTAAAEAILKRAAADLEAFAATLAPKRRARP